MEYEVHIIYVIKIELCISQDIFTFTFNFQNETSYLIKVNISEYNNIEVKKTYHCDNNMQ